MKKKLVLGAAMAVAACIVLAWGAAPILTAQALIKAAKARDVARIEQLVDFPALRASMKDELNAELITRMRRDPRIQDNNLGGLAMMLAPSLLEGAVDTVVTPQGVAMMVTTAEAPDPTRPDPPEPDDARDSSDIHQAWGYRSLNAFAVTLTDRDQPDQRLALILERRGLFAWKLAAVDLTLAD
ncbi:DUF2939 domain-containing protein [Brevundimonas sp. NPDC092305]|uniref:DUF2939 domain-containing protein n=1 Tax=Brevundimonas sp. NPDC092305 TaxID=3363957 RepID=UPI0038026BC0